jgi:acid phosphatase type 7
MLMLSLASNRSNPVPLEGQTVSGNIYVFVSPESGASQVRFYLDNPSASGTPIWTENNPPWDFAGGSVSAANPYNTTSLSNGAHSITASITLTSGGTTVITSNFTVNNSGSGTSCTGPFDQVHLAWVGDPSSTLNIVWRTCDTATPSTAQYRPLGSGPWLPVTGGPRQSGTAGTLHEVALTGLTASTIYEYQVQGDGGVWSQAFIARTAPPPGPATFDAIYYADTGLVGRADGLATGTQQVVDEIARIGPLLALPGGDYAYFDTDKRFGTLDNSIDAWFNQNQPIASQSVTMPTYGNHEVELGEDVNAWLARFPSPTGYDNRRNYSFDVGDVHFISLDASTDSRGLTTGQKQWLESDMQAAQTRGMRWIIPYFHVSPFADGSNHSSNLMLRADVGPIFERYGVKIALSSHDQAYERSFPLRDVPATNTRTSTSLTCYTMNDGTTYVKVSPGGKESNISGGFSPFASDPAPAWTAARDNTMHHFARLRVSPTDIIVDTYGVRGDGTPPAVIDSFRYTTETCP